MLQHGHHFVPQVSSNEIGAWWRLLLSSTDSNHQIAGGLVPSTEMSWLCFS